MPVIFSKKKLGKNRLDGFYETPIKTVEYMSKKILDKVEKNSTICDPCVGDGVFINYLHDNGIPKKNLFGYDIDRHKINNPKGTDQNIRCAKTSSEGTTSMILK